MAVQGNQRMEKVPQYNTTIFIKLNGYLFGDYLKTGRKDRYELMCAVDAYDKEHVPIPGDEKIDNGRPIPSASYKE